MENHSINHSEKLSFAIGAIGKDAAFAFMILSLLNSVYNSFALGGVLLAFIPIIGKFLNGISDPIIGFIIDKNKSKFGKFKPYIFFGSVSFVFFALCYVIYLDKYNADIDKQHLSNYIFAFFIYILVCFAYSFMDVAFWAMIPSFGSNKKNRDEMATIGRLGATIGYNCATILFSYILLHISSMFFWYKIIPYLILLFFMISQAIVLLNIKDRSIHYSNSYKQKPSKIIKSFLQNDQLLTVTLQNFLLQFIFFTVSYTVFIFLDWHSKDRNTDTIYLSLITLSSHLIAYCSYMVLMHKYDHKKIYVSSCIAIFYCLILILTSLILQASFLILIFFFMLSIAIGFSNVCISIMLANTVDYGEFRSNCRLEGIAFSMQTMTTNLAIAFALALIYLVPDLNTNLNQFDSNLNIYTLNIFAAILYILVVFYLYLKHYKLAGSFYVHMLNTLDRIRGIHNKEDLNYTSVRYALDEDFILMNLATPYNSDKENILNIVSKLSQCLISTDLIEDPFNFKQELTQKLQHSNCGIAEGIAIAHVKSSYVKRSMLALATLQQPLDCGAIDNKKCDLIFLIASPNDANEHLNLLGKLSLLLNDQDFCDSIRSAGSQAEILERIIKCEKCIIQE